ncbi:MAG: hypothetical protein Q8P57_00405 [Candidatus Pacearchaeota archaeon]|nr:hypothetical protein [Candidatus Pacearchaeota archaeon]
MIFVRGMDLRKRLVLALIFIIVAIIGIWILNFSFDDYGTDEVYDFQSCVLAGYPVAESYPRQCIAMGRTFVEEIEVTWKNDGVILMQNQETLEYACFGCNTNPLKGYVMCVDPAPVMHPVEETDEFYCNQDFEVIKNIAEDKI